MMSFVGAIKTCLRKYVRFSGRATRAEFWWFMLFSHAIQLGALLIDPMAWNMSSLALLLPSITVGVRRLHDTGKTGWLILAALFPLLGLRLPFIWARPSQRWTNAYGHGPAPG